MFYSIPESLWSSRVNDIVARCRLLRDTALEVLAVDERFEPAVGVMAKIGSCSISFERPQVLEEGACRMWFLPETRCCDGIPRFALEVQWDAHGHFDILSYRPGEWEYDLLSAVNDEKLSRSILSDRCCCCGEPICH
jgi:hypothetical protein